MFCRSPVGTPPLESATVSREARAEIAHSVYAAVLALSPEEFDRLATARKGHLTFLNSRIRAGRPRGKPLRPRGRVWASTLNGSQADSFGKSHR